MKRVLFISHYPGTGGANLSMLYLIKTLKLYGVEPLVFLPAHGPIEQTLHEYGIPYEIHRYASLRTANRGCIRNSIESIVRLLINIVQALILGFKLRNRIDIIHSNSSLVFFGVSLKFVMRKPLVWHLREFGHEDYDLIFSLGKYLSGWCYSRANTVIAISEAMNQYFKSYVYSGKNIVTIYNGVDESQIKCRLNQPTYSIDDKMKLCIVGGISEAKNQIDLINAVQLLPNDDFTLDIIGEGTSQYVDRLKVMVKNKGLEKKINFVGHKAKIGELLADYNIGIITSKNEAFGRVTIEYMLAGVPVIASNAGANKELIDNGKTGMFYELGDAQNLADKIDELISDKEYRQKLSLNAYNVAINNYTAKNNAQKVLEIYNKV